MIKEIGQMGTLSPSAKSTIGIRGGVFALACVIGGLSLSSTPVSAAHGADHSGTKQAAQTVTSLAAKDPETTSSITQDQNDDGPTCDRSRKRLWVEGEGWIVRRVTTCY
jgi:hypothetical protein